MRLGRNLSLALDFVRPPGAGVVPVMLVAAAKATKPATQSSGDSGNDLIQPLPTGTVDGQIMLAVVSWTGAAGAITPPAGWGSPLDAIKTANENSAIYAKVAASEPASWTWTNASSSYSRSGVVVTLAGGTVGDHDVASGLVAPDLTSIVAGAALIVLGTATGGGVDEDFGALSPLTLLTQHTSGGSLPYLAWEDTCVAIETNLSPGTVTGRKLTNPTGSSPYTYGVVIEPA